MSLGRFARPGALQGAYPACVDAPEAPGSPSQGGERKRSFLENRTVNRDGVRAPIPEDDRVTSSAASPRVGSGETPLWGATRPCRPAGVRAATMTHRFSGPGPGTPLATATQQSPIRLVGGCREPSTYPGADRAGPARRRRLPRHHMSRRGRPRACLSGVARGVLSTSAAVELRRLPPPSVRAPVCGAVRAGSQGAGWTDFNGARLRCCSTGAAVRAVHPLRGTTTHEAHRCTSGACYRRPLRP